MVHELSLTVVDVPSVIGEMVALGNGIVDHLSIR
jgi:hypothetical protein